MSHSLEQERRESVPVAVISGDFRSAGVRNLEQQVAAAARLPGNGLVIHLHDLRYDDEILRRAIVMVDRLLVSRGSRLAVVCDDRSTRALLERTGRYFRLAVFPTRGEAIAYLAEAGAVRRLSPEHPRLGRRARGVAAGEVRSLPARRVREAVLVADTPQARSVVGPLYRSPAFGEHTWAFRALGWLHPPRDEGPSVGDERRHTAVREA